ncbi:MAG: hypothetical protein JKY09_07980 [Crocinitomicaceae bacterium]|nr:hypothetical protein [Crocinitomicaceae bacterium]
MEKLAAPIEKWPKPFIEIALRGIRKANFDFEQWRINQIPTQLGEETFRGLNDGWSIFLTPEEHPCAYITQEFATSPFTKGYWIPGEKKKKPRYYMIEHEQYLTVEKVFPCTDYSKWEAKPNQKPGRRKADMLINRIGFENRNFTFFFDSTWHPTLIEAKRATILPGDLSLKPDLSILKNPDVIQHREIIKDVKKQLGLKIALKEGNCSFKHPHKQGNNATFFSGILFWGFKEHVDAIRDKLQENVSIEYDGSTYTTKNWTGIQRDYPYHLLNYKDTQGVNNDDHFDNVDDYTSTTLSVILMQFDI